MNLSLESLQLSENDSENPSPGCANLFQGFELLNIYDYHLKIINELDKTLLIWETHRTLDFDKHEWAKAERRASEFSARFTRNYLYPLRTKTRAITNQKTNPGQLLKTLTRAYQIASAALCTFNAYSAVPGNLPVLEKIKNCASDIKILRQSSWDILEPIEKTVNHDRDQLDNLCQKILDIPEVVYKQEQKHKMVPVTVKSTLDMYEPKLTTWARKTRLLAKLRHRKKSTRESVALNVPENQPDLKPAVVKVFKKPVELDVDVETAVGAYLCEEEKSDVVKPVLRIQPEKPTNVGLFCITSETNETLDEQIPEKVQNRERILKISPQILQELFR